MSNQLYFENLQIHVIFGPKTNLFSTFLENFFKFSTHILKYGPTTGWSMMKDILNIGRSAPPATDYYIA